MVCLCQCNDVLLARCDCRDMIRRRSIDFFRIREKEKLGDDSKKNSPPELPSEMELVPDNPDQEPGWKLVRTVFGTKKVIFWHFHAIIVALYLVVHKVCPCEI